MAQTIDEKTRVPLWVIGSILGLFVSGLTTVFVAAVGWGSIRTEVDAHGEAIKEQRSMTQGNHNDIIAQLMILRQDVSEIKGEMKR